MNSNDSQINKFRLSRRGQKIQLPDIGRTLVALPKGLPERTWAEILQKEKEDLIAYEIREEILEAALKIGYEHYIQRQNALFTTHCAAQAWLKLIDWHFYRHDPGEEPSAAPACFIPKRTESWIEDTLPEPAMKDPFSQHQLQVIEESSDEKLVKWASDSSLDMPVVDDIPEEYWFPGKVILKPTSSDTTRTRDGTRKPLVVLDTSGVWEFVSDISKDLVADSELVQTVTYYSSGDLSPQESKLSALKTTTPVDGSLQGAGDSTVVRRRRKTIERNVLSRASVSGRSPVVLTPLIGSRSGSKISIISDCRLRNLRLETNYEISGEKIEAPIPEIVKRK